MKKKSIRFYSIFSLLIFPALLFSQRFEQKGLLGEYFNQKDLPKLKEIDTEKVVMPTFTRIDENINFEWVVNAPAFNIKKDNFSVRWRGYIVPKYSEIYTFHITSNNGRRLWINENLIIDKWLDDKGEYTGTIRLTGGFQYYFKLEYFSNSGNARCKLEWESASQKREVIPAEQLIPETDELPPTIVGENYITRDPAVMLGADNNYYMVYTSSLQNGIQSHENCWFHNDGLHVWKSTDLHNWTDLGLVWSWDKDVTFQGGYDDKGRRVMWAPEMHFINNNYYVTYSKGWVMKSNILRSKTGKPEGPYEDVSNNYLFPSIDNTLFKDTDGKVYALYGNSSLVELNSNLSKVISEPTGLTAPNAPFFNDKKYIGFEGTCMIKAKGKYYVSAAVSNWDFYNNTYDCVMASADSIRGPYSNRWLLLRHGGHNNLFRDREGNLWTTLFGSGGENLIAINQGMVQLDMDDDGRILPLRSDARAFNILETNQYNTVKWKYTFTSPASDWFQKNFNDASWAEGNGGFGNAPIVRKTYISPNRTIWNTHDIWLRKTFNAGNITPEEIDKMLLFINHDDGADVYINGIYIANYPGTISQYHISKISDEAKKSIIPNGDNVIAIHAWNNSGDQFIDAGIISWKGSIYTYSKRGNGNGLLGHYFNGLNFNTKALQRTDKYINFNWPQSPDASVKADSFSVRWTGQIEPIYSEKYTFYVNSDNGVRLWINGQKLIDGWIYQTPNEFSSTISLQAGKKQDIILEYFNVKDIAKIKLEWESISQYRRVVPQSQLFPVDINLKSN